MNPGNETQSLTILSSRVYWHPRLEDFKDPRDTFLMMKTIEMILYNYFQQEKLRQRIE